MPGASAAQGDDMNKGQRCTRVAISLVLGLVAVGSLRWPLQPQGNVRDEWAFGVASLVVGTCLGRALIRFLQRRQMVTKRIVMTSSALAGAMYGLLAGWLTNACSVPVGIIIDAITGVHVRGLGPLSQAPPIVAFLAAMMVAACSGIFYGVAVLVHAPFLIVWGGFVGVVTAAIVRTFLSSHEKAPGTWLNDDTR